MSRVINFFREVGSELRKVTWPTWRETIRLTIVVIIVTTIVGIYVGGIDYALTKVLERFIN